MKKQPEIIIDSQMSKEEALAQNPKSVAPDEILNAQQVIEIEYLGFDEFLHRGQIVMNEKVVDDVKKFFETALELKFPIKKVIPISDNRYKWDDEVSCADNNSSGFNYRTITGKPHKISKHALGLAFDINPVQNVYVRYDKDLNEVHRIPPNTYYDPTAPGTLTADHVLVKLMKDLGWFWGGDWTPESGREDYQHFQKEV